MCLALLQTVVRAQNHLVPYSTSDSGTAHIVPYWGVNSFNSDEINRTTFYTGTNNLNLIQVGFLMDQPLVNNDLAASEKQFVASTGSLVALTGTGVQLVMSFGSGSGVNSAFQSGNGQLNTSAWATDMEAWQRNYAAALPGRTMFMVHPFNEPDYGWYSGGYGIWGEGSPQNLYDIMGLLQSSGNFNGVNMGGGTTLDCGAALTWYNAASSRISVGTTHCLNGSVASYVGFIQTVAAAGKIPFGPEPHNLGEMIIGANYGIQGGIWWGGAELARGSFAMANKGVQLGYADDWTTWTSGAVYRTPAGAIQAFAGGSERHGLQTSFRYYCKDRDVFYDGNGPRRDYTVVNPGSEEKVINVTYGADVPPLINGRYIVVNRNSSKVLTVTGTSTSAGTLMQQNTYTGGTYQQFDIAPYTGGGDQSYYSFNIASDGMALDLNNFSYSVGASIDQYPVTGGANQQWFFEYAGSGFFRIRNRWSGLYLSVANNSPLNGAQIVQSGSTSGSYQLWRLMPAGATVEFTAPVPPRSLTATANAASIALSWPASTSSDTASYTILRSSTSGGPYDTIARGVTATSYTDPEADQLIKYYYVVEAIDKSVNTSALSVEASATPTGVPAQVANYGFDGNTSDSSGNANNASVIGAATYGAGRLGTGSIVLDGSTTYVGLPPTVGNFSQITVAGWFFWNGGTAFQRLFDFGNSTSQYMYLTPSSNAGTMRFGIANGGAEQDLNASTALPVGQWTHVALTLASGTAQLFLNGVLASSASVTIKPSDFLPAINSIGKSQFDGDPLFNGNVDGFQIYNYALGSSAIAALAGATQPVSQNPVAYLKFDEGSGTTAFDSTGNGWNASLFNAATWVTGKFGSAVNISGTTSPYMSFPTGIVSGMTNFTISTWVNPTSISSWARIFDFGTGATVSSTSGAYMFCTLSNGSVPSFAITTSGYNNEQFINGTSPIASGTWTHVAVTLSGNTGSLYINGALVGTNNAMTLNPSSLGFTTQNYLGRSQFSADPYLNGSVDEFRVYSRALSAGEVAALASGTATAPTNLSASAGPQQIQLSWSPIANATGYSVAFALNSGGPYTTIASGLTSPTFTHAGLSYGTIYYYVVSETNITGTSPYSSELPATPQSPLITSAETSAVNVTPSIQSDDSSIAKLTIPSSVRGHTYQVQYETDLTNGPWTNLGNPQPGTGGTISTTLPVIGPFTQCFYRVIITR